MFLNILDKKRLNVLPALKEFKNDFYLAGGTGLALQLGHRDSVDFDFFCEKDFDTRMIFKRVKTVFKGEKMSKIEDKEYALKVVVDGDIKINFFRPRCKMLDKMIEMEYLRIASIRDIVCMKLEEIDYMSTNKDYTDLYFALKKLNLRDLLVDLRKKASTTDTNLILKNMAYFEKTRKERIKFRNGNKVGFKKVKEFLIKEAVKIYS